MIIIKIYISKNIMIFKAFIILYIIDIIYDY